MRIEPVQYIPDKFVQIPEIHVVDADLEVEVSHRSSDDPADQHYEKILPVMTGKNIFGTALKRFGIPIHH